MICACCGISDKDAQFWLGRRLCVVCGIILIELEEDVVPPKTDKENEDGIS